MYPHDKLRCSDWKGLRRVVNMAAASMPHTLTHKVYHSKHDMYVAISEEWWHQLPASLLQVNTTYSDALVHYLHCY